MPDFQLNEKEMQMFNDGGENAGTKKGYQGGSIQDVVTGQAKAARRIEQYELNQERYKHQEATDVIIGMVDEGHLSEQQGQKRFALMKMHQKKEDNAMKLDESAAAGADYVTTQQMLEEVLDEESKSALVRYLKQVTGYRKFERKVNKETRRRKAKNFRHPFPIVQKFVSHVAFETFIGFLMVVNGITIGVQVSADGTNEGGMFFVLEHIFTAVFVGEVILRVLADGWVWIVKPLNLADTCLIIFTGVMPMWVLGPLGIESGLIRPLQVLRMLRLIRLIRMVRMVKFFRIFWSLIRGFLGSGRTLLWTYVLLFAVLYVFAVFGVYIVGKPEVFMDDDHADKYFGDVPKALFTLFQISTLDSWSSVMRPLMKKSDQVAPYTLIVILVVNLAFMNLITAVIINGAFEKKMEDDELNACEARERVANDIEELRSIFVEIDQDGSRTLDYDEFMDAVHNNLRVQQLFGALGINVEDADDIWSLLDDGSGEVHVDRFADTVRAMQGDAKAKDSFTIVRKCQTLQKRLDTLSEKLKSHQATADDLKAAVFERHRQMGVLIYEMNDFMTLIGQCVPLEEAKRPKKELEKLQDMLTSKNLQVQQRDANADQLRKKKEEDARMQLHKARSSARLDLGLEAYPDGQQPGGRVSFAIPT